MQYRDGKAIEVLKGADVALMEPPAVSPKGEFLALLLRRDGRVRLHVVSADGAVIRPLSDAAQVRGAPAWSPDGQWIAIGGSDAAGHALFKFPINGGPPQRIVTGEALNPVWSPTEDLIVYAGAQVMALHTLRAVRPSNGGSVDFPLIKVSRLGERYRFLPGGRGLVYMVGEAFSQDFWLLDLSTKEKRQLTQLEERGAMRTFDIDPNGKRIVFGRQRQNSDVVLIEPRDAGK